MTDDALRALAGAAGLASRWIDNGGVERAVSADVLAAALQALGFPAGNAADMQESGARLAAERLASPSLVAGLVGRETIIQNVRAHGAFARLEFEQGGALDIALDDDSNALRLPPLDRIGYHRLIVDGRVIMLAIAPGSARTLASVSEGRRMWGLAAQIYGLSSKGDGGIGHFGAVADLAESAARSGADALALSPSHALFLADSAHYTPYSPSSRLFCNVLHGDPTLVFGPDRVRSIAASAQAQPDDHQPDHDAQGASASARADLIDWPRASQARVRQLRAVYASFRDLDLATSSPLAQDFLRFRAAGGAPLQAHATFEALHARQFDRDFTKWNWRDWPADLRDARMPAVAAFARTHEDEVGFHVFAQWLVDRSMARAQSRAVAAGMRIGLVSDLAVGTNAGGSHAWSRPEDMLLGLSIGAPPDMLAPLGQNWGLTTFSPRALRATGYEPFLATLRAAMRNAGGVRIDHVMGLARLWLTPDGANATDGVYMSYPIDDLLALIRLESVRHAAVVVGEDLGTVPHGLRDRLAESGVAGMRVLQFEHDQHRYYPPDWYPETAIAMTATHDTATLAGWWRGADIEARDAAGQLPAGRTRQQCDSERAHERAMAWDAFAAAGASRGAPPAATEDPRPVVDAALAFVARTPASLVLVPIEDALGLDQQPNLPGTTTEYPNWRRRYSAEAGAMLERADVADRLRTLSALRN